MLASSTEPKREGHNQGNGEEKKKEERGKENTNQRSSHDAG
jgi:hypothetical protein